MVRVIDGQITETELPQTGYLATGESVSGYDLLPESILKTEGWLPVVEYKPVYDESTQMLVFSNYEILKDKVIANYTVVDIPVITTNEVV